MFLMPLWGWLAGLAIFGVLAALAWVFTPQVFVSERRFPVVEYSSELGFDKPSSIVTVKYEEDGVEKSVEMTVAEFRKLVTGTDGSEELRARRFSVVSGSVFCVIGIAFSFLASYLFSAS